MTSVRSSKNGVRVTRGARGSQEVPLESKRECTRAAQRGTKARPTKPKGRGFGNG